MLRFIQVQRWPAAWLNPDKREIPGLPDAGFSGHSGPAVSTRHSDDGSVPWRSRLWGYANSSKRSKPPTGPGWWNRALVGNT